MSEIVVSLPLVGRDKGGGRTDGGAARPPPLTPPHCSDRGKKGRLCVERFAECGCAALWPAPILTSGVFGTTSRYYPTTLRARGTSYGRRRSPTLDVGRGLRDDRTGRRAASAVLSARPSRSAQASWEPPVDIFETERELWIIAALPGVELRDLDVSIDGQVLVVAGLRRPPFDTRGASIHRLEIPYGRFERRIRLPGGAASSSRGRSSSAAASMSA